ncbi:MAG: ribonuclease H family protein [Saprospiraceae bacterium]|nr:ribonuclease H family protein [Saprospiraceae bacterium]
MAKKKKYYVVWVGNNPGIYDSWPDAQAQIKGFPNARYKSFSTFEEASEAYHGSARSYITKKDPKSKKPTSVPSSANVEWNSISVDAACSGNPGVMEYQGVDTKTKEQIFYQGPFPDATNNVGEFLALVHALARFQKMGDESTPIYTDSKTAMAWVRKKKVNTQLKRTAKNKIVFELMERAEAWLKVNTYKNPIIKWETEHWGEIPADFGRK